MRERKIGQILLVILSLCAANRAHVAVAGALEVAPTTIDIAYGNQSAILYVANRGTKPALAQIEGFDWRQGENGDELMPSDSLRLSPPLVRLAPGQQQIVRLAIKAGKPETQERAFRLIVSELPNPAETRPHQINMLLQFSVPVFAEGPDESADALQWNLAKKDDGLVLSAHNAGTTHRKLSDVQLVGGDGAKTPAQPTAFCYILPGASRQWTVASSASTAKETLRVEAYDEKEGAAISVPLPPAP